MCLVALKRDYKIDSKTNKPKPITTHEDLEVWKVMEMNNHGRLISPYREHKYTFDKIEYASLGIEVRSDISENFDIERGFHAYTSLEAVSRYYGKYETYLVKFIIPKGSKLFISRDEKEIVSNKIMFPTTDHVYSYKEYILNNKLVKVPYKQ
jgi:hypothetical protein